MSGFTGLTVLVTADEAVLIEEALAALVTERAATFSDAKTAWQFVKDVVGLGRRLGIPMSPLSGWNDVPDWIAELPGGSYDMK